MHPPPRAPSHRGLATAESLQINPLCAYSSTSFPVTPSPLSKVNPSPLLPGRARMRICLPFLHRGEQGEGLHAPRSEMPGERDGVDGASPGKYFAFQVVGQREQHPDLLPGMCQTSLLDALMHHQQSRPRLLLPGQPVPGGGVRAPAGSGHPPPRQGRCSVTAAGTSRAARPASPHLSSPPFPSPLLPARCSWCSSRAEIRDSKKDVFCGQAVGTVSPAAQGRQMTAKAGDGCPSISLLPNPGPIPLGQPQHTVGELR